MVSISGANTIITYIAGKVNKKWADIIRRASAESEEPMCSLHSQYLNPVAKGGSATIHCLSQNAPERYKDAQGQKFYTGISLKAVPFYQYLHSAVSDVRLLVMIM